MLNVTQAASRKLGEIVAQQSEPVLGLRVSVQDGGCSCHQYVLSLTPAVVEGDWVGEFGGVKVLVDPESAPRVHGVEIDYVEDPQGSGFTIAHPSRRRGCRCGGAFDSGEDSGESEARSGSGGGLGEAS